MTSFDALGSIFSLVLIGAPALAAIALVGAHRHGRAHVTDYATLVVPTIMFAVVGYTREELRTGWALILWPVIVAVFSMYLLAAKVLVIDRGSVSSKRTSLLLLMILTGGSLVFSLLVPQLLE